MFYVSQMGPPVGVLRGAVKVALAFSVGFLFGLYCNPASGQDLAMGDTIVIPREVQVLDGGPRHDGEMPAFMQFSVSAIHPLMEVLRNGDVKFHRYATVEFSPWNVTRKAGKFQTYLVVKVDGQAIVIPAFQFVGY